MKKEKFIDALLEVIVELVLTVILFFLGWGFVKIFNLGKVVDTWDLDLMCLLGFAVLAVLIIVFCLVRKILKRKQHFKNENITEDKEGQ